MMTHGLSPIDQFQPWISLSVALCMHSWLPISLALTDLAAPAYIVTVQVAERHATAGYTVFLDMAGSEKHSFVFMV